MYLRILNYPCSESLKNWKLQMLVDQNIARTRSRIWANNHSRHEWLLICYVLMRPDLRVQHLIWHSYYILCMSCWKRSSEGPVAGQIVKMWLLWWIYCTKCSPWLASSVICIRYWMYASASWWSPRDCLILLFPTVSHVGCISPFFFSREITLVCCFWVFAFPFLSEHFPWLI